MQRKRQGRQVLHALMIAAIEFLVAGLDFQDRSLPFVYIARVARPMKSRVWGRTGFANRSFALRRCLVEILKRRDRLTAAELAGIAYGRRHIVRP
jgi:hypothetical protein